MTGNNPFHLYGLMAAFLPPESSIPPIANMVWLNEDECLNHGVNTMLVVNIASMKISVIVLIVSGISMVIISLSF
ncbi:hypothetical protein, partial [Yersinia pestis]